MQRKPPPGEPVRPTALAAKRFVQVLSLTRMHRSASGRQGRRLAHVRQPYLFAWRIGIDDADNGVFLPEQFGMTIPGLENANAHSPIHSGLYHTEVASRLLLRRREPASAGRAELRSMREEMIAGSFPYKKAKK